MMDGVDIADDPWVLVPGDHALVMSKRGRTRFGFAILLAFFLDRGRFPRHESEVDPRGIATLSQQLNMIGPSSSALFAAAKNSVAVHGCKGAGVEGRDIRQPPGRMSVCT
jgi:hypothetical protein